MNFMRPLGWLLAAWCIFLAGPQCDSGPRPSDSAVPPGWCELPLGAGGSPTRMGPDDYNVGYSGFVAPVTPGGRIRLHGHFPHARYLSITVYDEDFMYLDSITDHMIEPVAGANPFRTGVPRDLENLGEFDIDIVMEEPPSGERPPNTLYGGRDFAGGGNRAVVVAYRVYLPDQGYGFRDGHPLAQFGGAPSPRFQVISPDNAGCPSRTVAKSLLTDALLSAFWRNRSWIVSDDLPMGEPQNPVSWWNPASRDDQEGLSFVPNPDTSYLLAPISKSLGDFLVFEFAPPHTPIGTYVGEPFPPGCDMRYMSISFGYQSAKYLGVPVTEKTLADVDLPRSKDGAARMVVGLGGAERPARVPEREWVGLNMEEGIIVIRNIVVDPAYPGNFWNLPRGPVPAEYRQYTPGGVYMMAEDFAEK